MPMDVEMPDGTVIEGVPDGTTQDQLHMKVRGKYGVPMLNKSAQSYRLSGADKSKEPSWYEELGGGLKRSLDKSAVGLEGAVKGAANLIPGVNWKMDEGNQDLLKQGKAFVDQTGTMSSVGEVGGDLVQGLAAGGAGTAAVAGKLGSVLPQAVKFAAPLVTDVAANAGWGALTAPEDRGEAAAWGAGGTIGGALVGKGLEQATKWGGRAVKKGIKEFTPEGGAVARGADILERTLGKDETNRALAQASNPNANPLPRTTAGAAASPRLGALERGARGRGIADFKTHDIKVDDEAWKLLKEATPEAEGIESLKLLPGAAMDEGKAALDKIPLTKANREQVTTRLRDLGKDQDIIADAASHKQMKKIEAALADKNSKTGILLRIRNDMSMEPHMTEGMKKIKGVLDDVADSRSGGKVTETLEDFARTSDDLKAGEAAGRIRGAFQPEGVPKTSQFSGSVAEGTATPHVTSAKLRDQLGKELTADAGDLKYMNPDNVQKAKMLSDQLRDTEMHLPSEAAGSAKLDGGSMEDTASSALNAGPLWRLRGTLKAVFGHLNEKSQKAVDEALLDPQKFISMIEAKRASQQALQDWEAKLYKIVRGGSRVGGAIGTSQD
jgi:hypothetical protein